MKSALLLVLALLLTGCQVDSYCLDCKRGDGGGGPNDGDGGGGPNDGDGDIFDAIDAGPADACVPSGGPEVCDGKDNDCNGQIDENLPQVGQPCQQNPNPPCTQGVFACTNGEMVCSGAVTPKPETCNNVDDDCDGMVDDGNPGGGSPCGTAEGDCVEGRNMCVNGQIQCVGSTGPTSETCDNRDNDCDGMVDEGNPGGGAECGSGMGVCTVGHILCSGGVLRCEGASSPTLERCDGLDNDCDGLTDEDFNLQSDRNNCGMCGRVCMAANAVPKCTTGQCGIAFCLTDYWNNDGNAANGCEYHCVFQGNEVCNGQDDDCDGQIDEGVSAPAGICATLGECAGTTATCMGSAGFKCNYPATVSRDSSGNIIPETNCDNKDNDCDGEVDEAFPTKGNACTDNGMGVCQGSGTLRCNAAGTALTCNITSPGATASQEVCNGKDDDCDGTVDDNAKDNWVPITGGGVMGTKYIFQYEASRPNASATSQGTLANRACANPNVLPWTNVTFPQAEAACQAAGGRLCSETEWQRACNTPSTCTWGMSTCTTYGASTCNGNDFDFDAATAGDQDGLLKTGALANCFANWGAVATRIFDLSGNAKEWVQSAAGDPPNTRRLRGGSFNNTATGISCDFRFAVADNTFQFQNVGFRCCRDTAPP
jgi:Sulfatase-modifying factor enzyme 1/Putative metal-binding motif